MKVNSDKVRYAVLALNTAILSGEYYSDALYDVCDMYGLNVRERLEVNAAYIIRQIL